MKTKDFIELLEKTAGSSNGTAQITIFTQREAKEKAYQDTER